jgi:hypothetical protein
MVLGDFGHCVVRGDDGVRDGGGGNTCRTRQTQGGDTTSACREKRVSVTVVTTSKLDYAVPAGVAAGEPDSTHSCFGPAIHKSQLFNTRDAAYDFFR